MSVVGEPIHTFGVRRVDKVYEERPGAYGIAFDGPELIAVVRTASGLYLPGGGVDFGETHKMALYREFQEETGLALEWHGHLATVRQYITRRGRGSLEKICAYFLVRVSGPSPQAEAPEHQPLWMTPEAAAQDLTLEADRWAVRLAAKVVEEALGSED